MAIKALVSRYRSKCARCTEVIEKGEDIEWDSDTRQSWHSACASPSPVFGAQQEEDRQETKEDLPF